MKRRFKIEDWRFDFKSLGLSVKQSGKKQISLFFSGFRLVWMGSAVFPEILGVQVWFILCSLSDFRLMQRTNPEKLTVQQGIALFTPCLKSGSRQADHALAW